MIKAGFVIVDDLGRSLIFLKEILRTMWRFPTRSKLIFEQIWDVTMQSLLTTGMAGFFVGAIMSVQFAMQLKRDQLPNAELLHVRLFP